MKLVREAKVRYWYKIPCDAVNLLRYVAASNGVMCDAFTRQRYFVVQIQWTRRRAFRLL